MNAVAVHEWIRSLAMTFPKARLVVSACLFLAWIGFLGYLVYESGTVILSRPQFLLAQFVVVVEVQDRGGHPDPQVAVNDVIWPVRAELKKELDIPGLALCGKQHGYHGAGKYLLPLTRTAGGAYLITPMPPTAQTEIKIYPWTPATRAQVEELVASKGCEASNPQKR